MLIIRSWLAFLVLGFTTVNLTNAPAPAPAADFRPPAVPLVTYNPFLSIWSEADHLNDATTKHWTRHDHSLVSLIRIDGKTYRLMGGGTENLPAVRAKVRRGPADAEHLRIRGRRRARDDDFHAAGAAG